MRVRFLYGLLALITAGAGSAVAADMPVRPPPAVAPIAAPVYVPDWVGFYVGIHGGGGWGKESIDPGFTESTTPFFFTSPNTSPKGGVFGAQAGYNWQWGPVVGGLEVDFSGADIKESTTFFDPFFPTTFFTREFKIDELASARGRLGYLIFPNLLLYGTAGIGWGHTRLTTSVAETLTGFFATQTSFENEFGWVAGVGLEWKFIDHWLLRGEWLHYDFGRSNQFDLVTPVVNPGVFFPENVRTTVDVARAALSYKF